jgi:hypothetical protein
MPQALDHYSFSADSMLTSQLIFGRIERKLRRLGTRTKSRIAVENRGGLPESEAIGGGEGGGGRGGNGPRASQRLESK